jgi:predicted nucleic acid-binding protein
MEVLDASVGLKWVLNEIDSDKARRLLADFQAGTRDLIAPDVYSLECAHGLSKSQRKGVVTDAERLWFDLIIDLPALYPSLPLLDRALAIALKARIAVYDCIYVALAEREGCELITADRRVINALQKEFPFLTDLATMP